MLKYFINNDQSKSNLKKFERLEEDKNNNSEL